MMRTLLALFLLLSLPAAAQPAGTPEERRAAAAALVEVTGGQRQVDGMLTAMRGLLVDNIQRATAGRLTSEQVTAIVDEVLMPGFRERAGEITEHSARVWAERLSVAEMQQLMAFYNTDLGRRMLQLMPEITAEGVRFGQQWAERVTQDVLTRNRDQLRARGIPL